MPQYLGTNSADLRKAIVNLREFIKERSTGPMLESHLQAINDTNLEKIFKSGDDQKLRNEIGQVTETFSEVVDLLQYHFENDTGGQGRHLVEAVSLCGLISYCRLDKFTNLDQEIETYLAEQPFRATGEEAFPSPFHQYVLVIEGLKEGTHDEEEYMTLDQTFEEKMADLIDLDEGAYIGTGGHPTTLHGVCFYGTTRFVAAVAKRFPEHQIVDDDNVVQMPPSIIETPATTFKGLIIPRPKRILKL